jgi:uncharacterized protein (TIGR03435 family)
MSWVTMVCALATLAIVTTHAQAPVAAAPSFEVASIKRSGPPVASVLPGSSSFMRTLPGGGWSVQNMTLGLMLQLTHALPPQQIVGGPAWLHTERFDIIAKAGSVASEKQIAAMAKQLFVDRFSLRVHTVQHALAVYALVLARSEGKLGAGLRPTAVDCEAIAAARQRGETLPRAANGSLLPCGGARVNIVDGVRQLRMHGQPLVNVFTLAGVRFDRPLVNRTGLTGRFDIDLDYVPAAAFVPGTVPPSTGQPPLQAIQDQLGLKVERRNEMVDVLVIDHVDMPTLD